MKAKKIFTGILASALFLSSALSVSAVSSIETKNPGRDMWTSYSKSTGNGVGYMYYHVGSMNWGDDVSAYSETRVVKGMTGYASVTLKADNNQIASKFSKEIVDNSYIRTENACVGGSDQAEYVRFEGSRKERNNDNVGYNYLIK